MSTALVRSTRESDRTIGRRFSHEDVKVLKKETKRGRKKVTESVVPYLPDTIIYEILVRSSARSVYDCRLVKKEWRDNIISRSDFIAQNFKYSEPQLLLQCPTSGKRTFFDVKLMKFDESNNICKLSNLGLPRIGKIRPSCYGLFLVDIPKEPGILRVLNAVTKRHLTLPKFPSCCPHKACSAALVFDPSTKEFKVVHMYTSGAGFEILTLGRDDSDNKWKRVFLPWKQLDFSVAWQDPLLSENGKVLYWDCVSDNYIISMDIVEEKLVKTFLPHVGLGFNRWSYRLLEMAGSLTAVYYGSDLGIDIWVLVDLQTSFWYKRDSIRKLTLTQNQSDHLLPSLNKLVPVGCRNDKDLVFKYDAAASDDGGLYLYVYNMNKRELRNWFKTNKKMKDMEPEMKNWFKINKKMKDMEPLITYRSSLYHWDTFKE